MSDKFYQKLVQFQCVYEFDKEENIPFDKMLESVENMYQIWCPSLYRSTILEYVSNDIEKAREVLVEKYYFVKYAPEIFKEFALIVENKKSKDFYSNYYNSEKNHYKLLNLPVNNIKSYEESFTFQFLGDLRQELNQIPDVAAMILPLFEANHQLKENVFLGLEKLEEVAGWSTDGFKKHFEMDLDENHGLLWKDYLSLFSKSEQLKIIKKSYNLVHKVKHKYSNWQNSFLNKKYISYNINLDFFPGDFL